MLCLSAALAGCWDRTELNDLTVVGGMAVDAAPAGAVEVSLSLILPAGVPLAGVGAASGPGTPSTALVSAEGRSIPDAVSRLQKEVPARIFFGHMRVCILGAAYAREGIGPAIDFLLRDRSTGMRLEVVTTRGTGQALLAESPPIRSISTDTIDQILSLGTEPTAPLFRVATRLAKPRAGLMLPDLETVPALSTGKQSGGSGQGGSGAQEPTPSIQPVMFRVAGEGLFERGRLVGWMSADEASGANWLLGTVRSDGAVVDTPTGAEVSLEMLNARVRRRAALLPDGEPEIRIEVQTEEVVRNVQGGHLPLNEPQTIADLDALAAANIRDRMTSALHAAEIQGVDAFDFGSLLAEHEPNVWRYLYWHWPKVMPKLHVLMQVHVRVAFTGTLVNGPSSSSH